MYEKFMGANAEHLTDPVISAFEVALRMGHRHVGPEHLLLGMLEGRPDERAREILLAVGVQPDVLGQWFHSRTVEWARQSDERRREAGKEPKVRSSPKLNPAFYWTLGRAEGIAADRHEGGPTPSSSCLHFCCAARAVQTSTCGSTR